MFIIWGSKYFTKVIGETVTRYRCSNCNNANPFQIIKQSKWFTIFFIPIFPYSTKYLELCPICGRGSVVTKQYALDTVQAFHEMKYGGINTNGAEM